MNVLVVYAHPNPESFNASIFQLVCTGLQKAGHQVETLDLYQDDFEPAMSRAERAVYMDKSKNTTAVQDYVAQLQRADGLVLVYPTWWMGPPAILKGWFDRIWLPGVAADFDNKGVTPQLTNLKKIMVITTQGASKMRINLVMNPPRFMMKLSLKICTRCKHIDWLALYRMDKVSDQKRNDFLDKVRHKISEF